MSTAAKAGFNMAPAKTLSDAQLPEQIEETIRLFNEECADKESNGNMAMFYAGRLTALSTELAKRFKSANRRLGDIHNATTGGW